MRDAFRAPAPAVATVFLALVVGGCGDDGVAPDPSIAFLVAEWDAVRMIAVSTANPEIEADLIEAGATFFVDVQPSGQYTAILTLGGLPATEFGRVEVRGDELILHREQPGPPRSDVADYRLSGDSLFLEGATEFDFNLDGAPEDAQLFTDLVRRP